jgi:hypothetical protein
MANDKEIIKKLFAIAVKQQKIITKLAQGVDYSTESYTPPGAYVELQDKVPALDRSDPWAEDPKAMHLAPQTFTKNPAEAILNALDAQTRSLIQGDSSSPTGLKVDRNDNVEVKVKPGSNLDAVKNSVAQTVQKLQQANVLFGKTYNVTAVPATAWNTGIL